jgi:putative restriction endonuclease
MAILSKKELLNRISEAVYECGWSILYISTTHPFKLHVYKDDIGFRIKVYIWNLTHGGGRARPSGEYRIQAKVREGFREEEDWTTLILGWWDAGGVFAGFDLHRHLMPAWSSSIQIKEEALREGGRNGFAASDKGNEEIAIAFRPDFFIDYLQNLRQLHDFGESPADLEVLETISDDLEINEQDIPITDQ